MMVFYKDLNSSESGFKILLEFIEFIITRIRIKGILMNKCYFWYLISIILC
jgi:hypothetical protein